MGTYVWPCPKYSRISSGYGNRICPFHGQEFHDGVDLAAASGTPILAFGSGTVTKSGWGGGYGNYISIDHGGGLMSFYGHCSKLYVAKGAAVKAGQKIAAVGTTGNSTGNHLHFGIHKNGKPENPLNYVKDKDTAGNHTGGASAGGGNRTEGGGKAAETQSKEITKVVIQSASGVAGTRKEPLREENRYSGQGVEIHIQNSGQEMLRPIIEGDVVWETTRKGSPSTLKFTVVKDETLNFHEGNPVSFRFQGQPVFYGYVFEKSRSDRRLIDVTCYDQLRYFKNKDTLSYENKTYGELLSMLAADYHLSCGSIADTKYKIPQRIEETTLFDMLGSASDLTLMNTGKLYLLYDEFGKLTLKAYEELLLPILIDEDTAQSYHYTSSIDSDVYTRIKLAYDNGETGEREVHVLDDEVSQGKWGTLQYYAKLDSALSPADIQTKAQALLKYYNVKQRSLSVKDVFGDTRARAGASVVVRLALGDLDVSNYMCIEKAVHRFTHGLYTMDLSLSGVRGEFHA